MHSELFVRGPHWLCADRRKEMKFRACGALRGSPTVSRCQWTALPGKTSAGSSSLASSRRKISLDLTALWDLYFLVMAGPCTRWTGIKGVVWRTDKLRGRLMCRRRKEGVWEGKRGGEKNAWQDDSEGKTLHKKTSLLLSFSSVDLSLQMFQFLFLSLFHSIFSPHTHAQLSSLGCQWRVYPQRLRYFQSKHQIKLTVKFHDDCFLFLFTLCSINTWK